MIRADKFTCEVPTEGSVFLECSLPSAGAIEWFGAIVGALSLMVAAGAAWASIRFANREHQRAEKFEKKSVRERLSNQAVEAFASFATDPLRGDFSSYEKLNSQTLAFRENLDLGDPTEKRLHEGILESIRCAGIIHTYCVYFKSMLRRELPADRQIRLGGLAGELSREVQSALHGFAYTQNASRTDELSKSFGESVTRMIEEAKKYTTVSDEDK